MRTIAMLGLMTVAISVVAAGCQKPATENAQAEGNTSATINAETAAYANTNQALDSIIVTLSATGISQTSVTVMSGTQVIFRNEDIQPHRIVPDAVAPALRYPGLDGLVGSGGEYQITFRQIGDWKYLDQLHPDQLEFKGHVTVR